MFTNPYYITHNNWFCLSFCFINFNENIEGKDFHIWSSEILMEKKKVQLKDKNVDHYNSSILVQEVQYWEQESKSGYPSKMILNHSVCHDPFTTT